MRTSTSNLLYTRPLFGLDIERGSLKVMQTAVPASKRNFAQPRITGYGATDFKASAYTDGVITAPAVLARALFELFSKDLTGGITTRRAAITVPSEYSFSCFIQLPKLSKRDHIKAVRLEAQRRLPVPLSALYLECETVRKDKDSSEVFVTGVPKKIIDSYIVLARMVGIEIARVETATAADARLCSLASGNMTSLIIHIGTHTTSTGIASKHILAAGNIPLGSTVFTKSIKDALHVTPAEAAVIQARYGLDASKKQGAITLALKPALQQIVDALQHTIHDYEIHYGVTGSVSQGVVYGNDARLSGFSEYLTNALRLPIRTYDPWHYLKYDGLQAPNGTHKLAYATVAGLAYLTEPNKSS